MVLPSFDSSGYQAPRDLDALRVLAGDLARGENWAELDALRDRLRDDREFWPDLWGPACAVAARRVGDPAARSLFDDVLAAGFGQPETFDSELEAAFGDEPDWADLAARMAANASAPAPLEFLDWPTLTPGVPLELFRLPGEREAALRTRLPAPAETAWETARSLLTWVSRRWRHGNAHVDRPDAVACLDRVDAGERFACVEYALVLSQALNAVGIPSRRLSLLQRPYHLGLGRGHVVSEAWIDDLNRWVVLDGQNGIHWVGVDGLPLGAVELQALVRDGAPPPPAVLDGAEFPADRAAFWYTYFGDVSTTGAGWAQGGFGAVFQRDRLRQTPRLERDPGRLYPDLSEIGIGVELVGDRAAVRLLTAHPFADGYVVDGLQVPLDDPLWKLTRAEGEHEVRISVRTRWSSLPTKMLRYRVR
jgi:hypothetical protein